MGEGFVIRRFEMRDTEQVVSLWQRCRLVVPWNSPIRDIERKLAEQPEGFLVGEMDGKIVATVMAGYDGHRGWVNYLAVAPELQRRGLGGEMMAEAERRLEALGCPKVQLQVRNDNAQAIAFYRRLGYTEDAVVSMGKRIVRDDRAK